jgi:hypothetical protein
MNAAQKSLDRAQSAQARRGIGSMIAMPVTGMLMAE